MADQTNPWGSAPSTDSAAQAADAWGGASTAAPANGGGADWLHSAPAPQPEQFNIMDPFHKTLIPLDSWVTHAIDWIVLHFRPLFQGIRVPIDYILSAFQQLLLGMPAPVAIIVFALIAWQISSLGMGVATLVSLIAIGAIGAWSQAMVTLALVLTALLFCMVIGLPLGIWLARSPLGAANLIGREELQHARDTVASAQAELDVAIQQYNANQAIVLGTRLEQQPAVLQAATEVRNAWLALQRTQIVSPISGYVSRRSVQPGAQIGTTTPLMAVVPATNLWIDANFKETQLAHMRIGQPATVISDIYGDDVKYTGKVVGLDMGTGSAFSLLPAQNATGNWIKVVQRLPVRIELDEKQLAEHPLRIGLSTLVEVNTTDRDGEMLASQVRSSPVYESNAREIALDPVNKLIDEIIQANAG
ncbi:HlyD family secretion protein [Klebsiella pneumoniae]|uniref:HlyD family secretion protein n=1 Tax=Klebsiella pneumoniae TaxID=573 RepID=UPI00280ACC99|nr:HlyD family secretion protein [Klebsiella pneumoniae]